MDRLNIVHTFNQTFDLTFSRAHAMTDSGQPVRVQRHVHKKTGHLETSASVVVSFIQFIPSVQLERLDIFSAKR